jgi:glycine/D-amino acid oxidase-like deaminating enzyme
LTFKASAASKKTGHNLWDATARTHSGTRPLEEQALADLVVIGGGFTGCSAALHAAGQGAKVRLLEAETIGHGGSGRNVGLVNAGLWMPPDEVEEKLGRETGAKLNAVLAAAPDLVFSLIERHGMECEATRVGTLHCAHSAAGLADLEARFRQQSVRGAPMSLLDAAETEARTGTSAYRGALFDARAGTIQPLAYCRGLAGAAQAAGAQLHERSAVHRIERDGGDWLVRTEKGSVRARGLLLATNAYHQAAAGVAAPAYVPVHYFQAATKPLSGNVLATILPGREGCWDTATIMSSFRLDAAGRLIVGGIGALDHAGSAAHKRWAARKIGALFPQIAGEPLDYFWFGRIAMTNDHLPKILRLGDNAFSVFGYSGRGIGPGTVFGRALAGVLLGGGEAELPIGAIDSYSERFTGVKGVVFEAGATVVHMVA